MNRSTVRRSGFAVLATVLAMGAVPAWAGEVAQPAVCRGAGFWGTHAGNEKGGTNIAQELIDSLGCFTVCGEIVDSTSLNDADSAVEALCVSPKSQGQVQLARQLTASALNCILSTGSPYCDVAWADCNEACIEDDALLAPVCRSYFSCVNEGGIFDVESGACQTGTCEPLLEGVISGAPCGPGYPACGEFEECVPTIGCDDAELLSEGFDFTADEDKTGSSKKCHNATRSTCAFTGPNETACGAGTESGSEEFCE